VVLSHAAWWGLFTTPDDRQRLEAVIRQGVRFGFCSADQSPLSELVEAADDYLFNNILCNKEHFKFSLYLVVSDYELRPRRHNRSLDNESQPP